MPEVASRTTMPRGIVCGDERPSGTSARCRFDATRVCDVIGRRIGVTAHMGERPSSRSSPSTPTRETRARRSPTPDGIGIDRPARSGIRRSRANATSRCAYWHPVGGDEYQRHRVHAVDGSGNVVASGTTPAKSARRADTTRARRLHRVDAFPASRFLGFGSLLGEYATLRARLPFEGLRP